MKRTTQLTILSFAISFLTASSAQACFYCPWLDPFAWLGLYGCGCGGGCYGGGYGGYQQPIYGGYRQPVYVGYAPQAPVMNYPMASSAGCNCLGMEPQQRSLSAVQVPVTTYRAVTQYVPQTTYRTQYQYQPTTAYAAPTAAPVVGGLGYPSTAYAAPVAGTPSYPATAYGTPAPITHYGGVAPSTVYPSAGEMLQPGIPSVTPGSGVPLPSSDVAGDHEYPSQSAYAPTVPYQRGAVTPIRPASYGVTPRPARTFSAAVH